MINRIFIPQQKLLNMCIIYTISKVIVEDLGMTTYISDIEKNIVKEADIVAQSIDMESAKPLAKALLINTSITKLDLSLCDLEDAEFEIIAKALCDRETGLVELNLDFNDLTLMSLPSMNELIKSEKVKTIYMCRYRDLDNDPAVLSELNNLASQHGVKISTENPRERESPGFFARLKVKQQGGNSFEAKEQPAKINGTALNRKNGC
jgi:hypothetical protein